MSEELENTIGAQDSTKDSDRVFPDTHRVQKCAVTVSDENGGECAPLPKERIAVTTSQISKSPTISDRKLQANRANAKKSTGPRTARGKARSRRNAVRHGLTSSIVMFDPQRAAIAPGLQPVSEILQQKLASGKDQTDPILHSIVVEYAHQHLATVIEANLVQNAFDNSSAPISLRNLLRYRTASRRALLKSLAELHGRPWAK